MVELTSEQVLQLAPDAGSAKNASKLASPARWPTLSRQGGVLWGECQGSGVQPYLVGVDLRASEVASKCSCPSRKFPCKHALALLLLQVRGQGAWQGQTPPEVLGKWLDGRQARNEAVSAPTAARPPGAAGQARRQAARQDKVTRGLSELSLWLQDLVREGLNAARARPHRSWEGQAARLIDAQVPGAARMLRQLSAKAHVGEGEALLAQLGKLTLLCEGWKNRERLSEAERLQLLIALGQPLDTAALLTAEGGPQRWSILGHVLDSEDQLAVRRTWLRRVDDGQVAALVDFAAGGRGFSTALPSPVSATLDVRMVPTLYPERAVLASSGELNTERGVPALPDAAVADLHRQFAEALARNPWLERIGAVLGPVRVQPEVPELQDRFGRAVPLGQADPYELLAQEESRPLHLFGEFDGVSFVPVYWQGQPEVAWPETGPEALAGGSA